MEIKELMISRSLNVPQVKRDVVLGPIPQPINQSVAELFDLLPVLECLVIRAAPKFLQRRSEAVVHDPRIRVRKPHHFELPQDFRKVSVEGSLENGADDPSAYSVFSYSYSSHA